MLQGPRQASVPSTEGPPSNTNSDAILQSDQPPRDAAAREEGHGGTGADLFVRGSAVAPCVSCGICGGLLRDATAFPECHHAFCRNCIHDKVAKDNIKCCPKCGIFLGNPLEKLRPDHSLQHIRSLIFPAKRRKVVMKKTKRSMLSEITLTAEGITPLTPAASEIKAQKELVPVGRVALSRIGGQDFDLACGLKASPVLEEMVVHSQFDSKQDPKSFRFPMVSDIEHQRQGLTAQMTNIPFMVGSSSHARSTVQDDENLRGDFLTLINESNTRIMGMYDAHISKLKAENTKLIEKLENERAGALERTRILEERLQQELENQRTAADKARLLEMKLQRELELEREAAIERTRVLDEKLQREYEIARTTASRNETLEKENFKLHEELEHGRADNQALMSDILEKSDELATLKYYSYMLESERKCLENQVEDLNEELKSTRKDHTRYIQNLFDAARAVPKDLEPINSDALPGSRPTSKIC